MQINHQRHHLFLFDNNHINSICIIAAMTSMRTMFHTQGYRLPYLTEPIICSREDAWLGEGYYFWYEEQDAIFWGQNGKKAYKKYIVYKAVIDCQGILDTVFNEKHYLLWYRAVEKIADDIFKKSGRKATIPEINNIIKMNKIWESVSGIMFQDIPNNQQVNKVINLYYRKRIQLVCFEMNIIHTFTHHFEAEC
ncbi:hypothetical protein [Mucilaginibacter paludis]|nr:hypothetical protein [Mucilaginibacter paludis]